MTTTAGIGIHVEPSEISHHYHPAGKDAGKYGTLDFGRPGNGAYGHLFFETDDAIAVIDAVIAELVALRAEMDPPAPDLSSLERCVICDAPSRLCGHNDGTPRNVGPAPVITDSERTCDQANPGTGAWCHRDGDHGVHEDTDGQTWRTDGVATRDGLCEYCQVEPATVPLTNGKYCDACAPGVQLATGADVAAPERCEDEAEESGASFFCTLNAGHAGLHAQLTPTGAFMAEWGYADGHVHTTAGHQPASATK